MENVNNVKQAVEDLLSAIGVTGTVDVKTEDEGYNIVIDSDENALLIGKHGNTLSSLELVIALVLAKKTGEYKRVIIEIGDYRKEREEYLKELASRFKEEVVSMGHEKKISGLKPWERRLIHIHLAEDNEVATESTGDDKDRVLIIKKK